LAAFPAGDKYFWAKRIFQNGYSRLLTDTSSKGKKIFSGIGNFFSFAMQYLPDGFLADDFHRHQRLRQAALQVRLRAPRFLGESPPSCLRT